MNLKPTILLLAVAISARAQNFQNLDFEQANPVPVGGLYPPYVTTTSALPYWNVYFGNVLQTMIVQNEISFGAPDVTLLSTPIAAGSIAPLDGNYSVILEASGVPPLVSLTQTGLIPTGTQSLFFEAKPIMAVVGPLDLLIGNQLVPTVAVDTEPNYTVYGANISAWAGQIEQLTFTVPISSHGLNQWELDDISFSQTAIVPEPSPVILSWVGGLIFALHRRFRQR